MTKEQAAQNYNDSVRRIRAWQYLTFRRIETQGRLARASGRRAEAYYVSVDYEEARRTYRRAMQAAWRTWDSTGHARTLLSTHEVA